MPITRLELTREGSDRVDWKRSDLAHLLALERSHPLEFSIGWDGGVGRTRVWRAAVDRAKALSG